MGFGGLYISITGLQASRMSLDTVSHNISNANNPNYVRQSAIHANNPYTTDGRFQKGTGVNVIEVRQIRDEFLDIKVRREITTFGYHYAKSQILEDLEGVFNEISNSSLQKVMHEFWKNWNELSKEPDSLTIRGLVHESSVAFTDTANHISRQLNDIRQNLNKEILVKVDEVNNILNEIGQLNNNIKLVEGEGSRIKANDFRDERNALLDRLSELIPVTSYENAYGETVVSLQGRDLINGNYISTIDIKNDENGLGHIYWKNSNEKIELNGQGELAGFIDVRDSSMVTYMNKLDELVGEFANEVNKLHERGFDLERNNNKIPFFIGSGGKITAANIKVNPELSNYNKIAISSTNGAKGDGEIAKEICKLRDKKLYGDRNGEKDMDIEGYYRNIILTLGIEREASQSIAKNQGFLIKAIDDKRKSISNVSLDEEMADMIRFQHSYSANSRVINAIDEMIETVVTRVGLVGR
ncbi:flagellar hook-associated protein FlgK [Tissierella praeacuta]|uniref:flagellar hook-associated protein FlgK n=1 Tax=Tissierella praeacuta TaxID=43131 RepID=UPI003517347D